MSKQQTSLRYFTHCVHTQVFTGFNVHCWKRYRLELFFNYNFLGQAMDDALRGLTRRDVAAARQTAQEMGDLEGGSSRRWGRDAMATITQ
jgi:hypothetical protein